MIVPVDVHRIVTHEAGHAMIINRPLHRMLAMESVGIQRTQARVGPFDKVVIRRPAVDATTGIHIALAIGFDKAEAIGGEKPDVLQPHICVMVALDRMRHAAVRRVFGSQYD